MKIKRVDAYVVQVGDRYWTVLPDGTAHLTQDVVRTISKRRALRLAAKADKRHAATKLQADRLKIDRLWLGAVRFMAYWAKQHTLSVLAHKSTPWFNACQSMASAARYRDKAWAKRGVPTRHRHSSKAVDNWDDACQKMASSSYGRHRWHVESKWYRWAHNKASNIQKRINRKAVIDDQRSEGHGTLGVACDWIGVTDVDPETKLQMRFEWD